MVWRHALQMERAAGRVVVTMKRAITGWHQDEVGDWVAELSCGHGQHVRHTPPLSDRPWVVHEEGRVRFLGFELNCRICDGDDIRIEPAAERDDKPHAS